MVPELNDVELASLATYDPDEMRVCIFADTAAGRAELAAIARGMNGRVLVAGDLSDGRQLMEPVLIEAVLVDMSEDLDADGTLFLDRLGMFAEGQRVPVLVNCVPELIDVAAGVLFAPSTVLMCGADRADWAAALSLAKMPRGRMLHDAVIDDDLRLQRLSDEVARIARTLAELADHSPATRRGVRDAITSFRAEPEIVSSATASAGDVRAIIRMRRLRDRFFPSDLFADPAWDMLLDLVAARIERTRVAVSSLCIAAAVPPTTALRWIKTMTDNGMFVRAADPEDGRRIFIELSQDAAAGMLAYLRAVKASEGLAI